MNWLKKILASKMSLQEAYSLMGINRENTNLDELKTVYRKLAKQYHPDLVKDPNLKIEADNNFKKINEANEIIAKDIIARDNPSSNSENTNNYTGNYQEPAHEPTAFEKGYNSWLKEQQEYIMNLHNMGYSEEQIDNHIGYDKDDEYLSEHHYVADSMRKNNDRRFYRDFSNLINTMQSIPSPDIIAEEKATEAVRTIAKKVIKNLKWVESALKDNYFKDSFKEYNIEDAKKRLVKYLVNDVRVDDIKEPFLDKLLLNNLYITHSNDLFSEIFIFKSIPQEELNKLRIHTPDDVDLNALYNFLVKGDDEYGYGRSNLPVSTKKNIAEVVKKAVEYRNAINKAYKSKLSEKLTELVNTGEVKKEKTYSEKYVENKISTIMNNILTNKFGNNEELKNQYKDELFDYLKEYIAYDRHDFEPDAGVAPYHTNVTQLEFLPLLDEYLNDEYNMNELIKYGNTTLDRLIEYNNR